MNAYISKVLWICYLRIHILLFRTRRWLYINQALYYTTGRHDIIHGHIILSPDLPIFARKLLNTVCLTDRQPIFIMSEYPPAQWRLFKTLTALLFNHSFFIIYVLKIFFLNFNFRIYQQDFIFHQFIIIHTFWLWSKRT